MRRPCLRQPGYLNKLPHSSHAGSAFYENDISATDRPSEPKQLGHFEHWTAVSNSSFGAIREHRETQPRSADGTTL